MILSHLSQNSAMLVPHQRGGSEAGLALVNPRTNQGELGSFTTSCLCFRHFDDPGATEACAQLGVLGSAFTLLPAHLKMELI